MNNSFFFLVAFNIYTITAQHLKQQAGMSIPDCDARDLRVYCSHRTEEDQMEHKNNVEYEEKENVQKAQELFDAGYSCAQSVFGALAPEVGVDLDTALKLSAVFGGGLARTGGTCGALSGALMAYGLKFGTSEISPEIKERMYRGSEDFVAAFRKLQGATTCNELIEADYSTPEGRADAKSRNVHGNVCSRVVKESVNLFLQWE